MHFSIDHFEKRTNAGTTLELPVKQYIAHLTKSQ